MDDLSSETPRHIFLPQYPIKILFGKFIIGIIGLYGIYDIYNIFDNVKVLSNMGWASIVPDFLAILFLPYLVYLEINLISKMDFYDEYVIIHHRFRRIKTYGYHEVVDLHQTGVKIGSEKISFSLISNAPELFDIIKIFITRGKIKDEYFSGEIGRNREASGKAYLISIPIALVLSCMFWYVIPHTDSELVYLLILMATYAAVYWLIRSKGSR